MTIIGTMRRLDDTRGAVRVEDVYDTDIEDLWRACTEPERLARWIGETPVYDVVVGDGEGMVGLRELERHFVKLPRNIKPVVVNDLDRKLKAMPAAQMSTPKPF